ncbi:hypothetical protein [Salinibacterium sp. PAMC 21357]|uniref:hypothetical protein n=1 Tax=Salinibacterium sp. PAMC 21357 TaxID=1112215 RepID=UPI000289C668|nr:hypothetical protein [Salinibacterium sp. PAMC 21357]
MKRATIGAFWSLGINLALYLGILGFTSVARAQGLDWSHTATEWISTVWYWSIWLMAASALLIVVLIAAQIVWAYLPRSWSRS